MPSVNPVRANFIPTLNGIKSKTIPGTQCQLIFDETIYCAGQTGNTPDIQYANIYDILDARDDVHNAIIAAGLTEDVSVTGKVTELICEIALKASANNRYHRLPQRKWDWVGDFAIIGTPFNVFISVKSYKAKERLMVSGMGQFAAPIIGYGLFNDPKEWSSNRVKQYRQKGFIAIYMPKQLYDILAAKRNPVTNIKTIYDQPLLRKLEDFATDIKRLCTSRSSNSLVMDYSTF